jgi:hypothetical protein
MNYLLNCLFFIGILSNLQAQNVGIGTATPEHKLVVKGDRINLQNTDTTKFFYTRTDGDEIDITTIGSHLWITAEEDKHIILNPNKNSSGNIGIGIDSPTEKLHIDGATRVSSLQGEGHRLLVTSPTGVITASNLELSELKRNNQKLKEKIDLQERLIQNLLKRVELLENN